MADEEKQEPKTQYERAIAQIAREKRLRENLRIVYEYRKNVEVTEIDYKTHPIVTIQFGFKAVGENITKDTVAYVRRAIWDMYGDIIARAKELLKVDTQRVVREANEEARQILDSVYYKGADIADLVVELVAPEKIEERIAQLEERTQKNLERIERLKKKKARNK